MDRDTDREGLRFPLRYNLIGIDCNSWGLSHTHTWSLSLTYTRAILQAQGLYEHNNKCRDDIYKLAINWRSDRLANLTVRAMCSSPV